MIVICVVICWLVRFGPLALVFPQFQCWRPRVSDVCWFCSDVINLRRMNTLLNWDLNDIHVRISGLLLAKKRRIKYNDIQAMPHFTQLLSNVVSMHEKRLIHWERGTTFFIDIYYLYTFLLSRQIYSIIWEHNVRENGVKARQKDFSWDSCLHRIKF